MIVQKARSKAYPASGGHICQSGIVISAVEVIDFPGADQAMLNRFQGLRGASAYHQCPPVQVLFADQIFTGKRIIFICDQVDPAFKQVVDLDTGNLSGLFLQGE